MVKIAVAGGSQGLGSALVQGLESHGSHEVRILSRKALDGDARYLAVDYSSIEELQTVLESNNIHTVISALSMENGGGQSQMNLIEAAERSKSTRRFMPSEFGIVHIAALPSCRWKLKASERLANSLLEYTLFSNGLFLDYLTSPLVSTPLVYSLPVFIDLENNFAALPGDGNATISMAHTIDISRYVAAIQDLPKWETHYHLIGDRLSLNDAVRIAEEIKGTTFERHHDSEEELLKNRCIPLPIYNSLLPAGMDWSYMIGMIAATGVRVIDREMDLDTGLAVNRLFPDMQRHTVRDAVQMWNEASGKKK
ncbi:hypothetical protein ASPVEDRAFT_135813 [Aspergillus versicolor CBS 583.65]|uniref:Uncharacterized protein n=1 Tax=Aspergillus versicolor CBS 583.65 TaxID=1036611 RepID=A0A1L9PQY6_ASPVE|nr:uncharacterized protein ASPVEDRAFT_135813 [Aspergillus versicolor CBS 583.65]OJJ03919.1 hypothetical protein ASPVEDRAFT_135813 [Aspergillus versicolor CBS 583.65]